MFKEEFMRIIMLSWEYPPRIVGGISRVVYDLAQNLGAEGNEIHVVTCCEHGAKAVEKDENVFVHRVATYDINPTNFTDWVLQLNFAFIEYSSRLIGEFGRFDIIHAHDWIVAFAARVLKYGYNIPMVCTIHATEYGRNWGIYNDTQKYISSIEWMLTYEAWKVIVNSGYMKTEVRNIFSLPEDKIRIVHNGVDIDKFKGLHKDFGFRRNYASDNEKIVFFVGRLVHEKGVHVLMDAIPKILSYYNDVKFVIAGKGPQLDYLRMKTAEMGISQKVYFTGYISDEDLARLYKCCDIAVVPSLYEPFGIVALEGIVAGVPVVVSDTGGLGEIVEHGRDGMKFYTGNSNSLADCILELLFNPDKVSEIVKNAYEKAARLYDRRIISMRTLEVYREILDENEKVKWTMPKIRDML